MTEEVDPKWPNWIRQVEQFLSVYPQFAVSGNIRDLHFVPAADVEGLCSTLETLQESLLRHRRLDAMLVYDRVDGLAIFPLNTADQVRERLDPDRLPGSFPGQVSLTGLSQVLQAMISCVDLRLALVVDYASRLIAQPGNLNDAERDFFAACQKTVDNTYELRPAGRASELPFNPVFWLIDGPNDLPDWFNGPDGRIKGISVEYPGRETRWQSALTLVRDLPEVDALSEEQFLQVIEHYVDLTEGIRLDGMQQIRTIAVAEGIEAGRIADAVQIYKVGVHDNPWRQPHLRTRLANGEDHVGQAIKGQPVAVQKTTDILKRSVMGLSGSQAAISGSRPRGVLFFAGPTGVGKTELAKAVTRLIFNDEHAYIRFDMSEFSSEQAGARLIGAPPGYVGYDSGGELVNAVRRKPFCLILFDEIEKGHPRILDKFLQILEDGRLTDGRGRTVYFSEAVIVFTSNLGMYVDDGRGERRPSVTHEDSYAVVEARVREAIADHFRFELQRPEILNRFGDNIVVFDFIRAGVAEQIFEKMLGNVKQRVTDEHGIELDVTEVARGELLERCAEDLSNGGRGIGSRLETYLINPLSRGLFAADYPAGAYVRVERLIECDGTISLALT